MKNRPPYAEPERKIAELSAGVTKLRALTPTRDASDAPPSPQVGFTGYTFEDLFNIGEIRKFKAVGRLAGGVVHDFRNILTCISAENRMKATERNALDISL